MNPNNNTNRSLGLRSQICSKLSVKPPQFILLEFTSAPPKRNCSHSWRPGKSHECKKNAAPLGAAVIATLNHIAMPL